MTQRIASIYRVFQWVLFLVLALSPSAHGAVPGSISIQGTLQSPGGGPLTGAYVCRLRFLDQEAGGQELGSVTQTIQISEAGRFSIQVIPPQQLLDAVQPGYELAVDVDGDGFDAGDVFPNLVTIQSVPFALRAGDAESLDGQESTSFMPAAADDWVNTTGDGMTGTLSITGGSASSLLDVQNNNAGANSRAVRGSASAEGAVTNYGGSFEAAGDSGRGVQGVASATGDVTNFGGSFEAAGASGRAVYG